MSKLEDAHEDINIIWQYYKKFEIREPKDDAFYHDLALAAGQICPKTKLGRGMLYHAVRAISMDDAVEKGEFKK